MYLGESNNVGDAEMETTPAIHNENLAKRLGDMYAAVLVTQDIASLVIIFAQDCSSLRRDSELGCYVAILEKAVSQQKCLVGLISRQLSGHLLPWQRGNPIAKKPPT